MYLQQPLMENYRKYLTDYSAQVLKDGGKGAFIDAAENLAEEGGVATRAPVEFGDLRASGHPTVTSDGEVIYDRPPRQHRQTTDELKAKDKAREALPGAWIPWSHGEIRHGLNIIHARKKP